MFTSTILPGPDSEDTKRIQNCIHLLSQQTEFKKNRPISLRTYMEETLYGSFGYYQQPVEKIFGKQGSFHTAPVFGKILAKTISRFILDIQTSHPLIPLNLIEYGPGNGILAKELQEELIHHLSVPPKYWLIEKSITLRAFQKKTLKSLPWGETYHWTEKIPHGIKGIVLSNELFDALPCNQVYWDQETWSQLWIRSHLDGLEAFWGPPEASVLKELPTDTSEFPEARVMEIHPSYQELLSKMGASLSEGYLLILDYGNITPLSSPEGSLRCYYKQHLHEAICAYPGVQDLTTDVNFQHLVLQASALNLSILGFTTQAGFLLGGNQFELDTLNTKELFKQSLALHKLLQPFEMGERIKVLCLGKNRLDPLRSPCFNFQDWRVRL